MKKLIYLIFVLPYFSFGQVEQLTTYQEDNIADKIKTHQYNNRIFYSYTDQDYTLNIYEIVSDSLTFVFDEPLSNCNVNSTNWYFYKNIVIGGSETRIVGYNFLTGEELFDEDIVSPFSINGSSSFHISQAGVLSGEGIKYDLLLNQFINELEGFIYFRQNNFYFYKRDDAIYKRNIDDLNSSNELLLFNIKPESTTRFIDSLFISYQQLDTVVYIFNPNETISHLHKDTNQVYTSPMLLEGNKMSFIGNSKAIFLYDLNINSLIKEISLDDEQDIYNFPIVHKSLNGLVYYSWSHPYPISTEIKTLCAYDYSLDSIILNLDLTVYDIGNFWGPLESVDSYIFGLQANRDSILVFNCNSNTYYLVENIGISFLRNNGFTDNRIYFFDYGSLDNHPDLYAIAPNNDSLNFLNNPSLSNFGLNLNYNLETTDNMLYDIEESSYDSKGIKIYDENIIGHIKTLPSTHVYIFEDNYYYVVKYGENCNLVVYNTSSSEEIVLLSLDNCSPHLNVVDNYIKLPFNSSYPYSIYNIYTEEVTTVSNIVFSLASSYIGNGFSVVGQDLFTFNIHSPDDYELISEITTDSHPQLLGDNLTHYRVNDSLFFANQEDKYFITKHHSDPKFKYVISPDNEKFLFIDGNYAADNINIKIINANNGQVLNEVQIEDAGPIVKNLLINDNKLLYLFTSGYNDKAFFLIDFEDNSIVVSDLVFDDYSDYFSKFRPLGVYNNNFHVYSKITNEIVIYNADFVEIERHTLVSDEDVELTLSSIKHDFQISKMPCLNKKGKDAYDLGYVDFEDMSYTKIIGCEEGIFLDDYIIKDSIIYFKGTNHAEGTQIYSYILEELATNVKDKKALKNDFLVFPNPTSDLLVFENKLFNIKIYNSNGAEVINQNDCKEINVSQLIEGVYFVVYNDGHQIKSSKFIKD